jgi:hypothetical protein
MGADWRTGAGGTTRATGWATWAAGAGANLALKLENFIAAGAFTTAGWAIAEATGELPLEGLAACPPFPGNAMEGFAALATEATAELAAFAAAGGSEADDTTEDFAELAAEATAELATAELAAFTAPGGREADDATEGFAEPASEAATKFAELAATGGREAEDITEGFAALATEATAELAAFVAAGGREGFPPPLVAEEAALASRFGTTIDGAGTTATGLLETTGAF